jgi:hypothetical protein
LIADDGRACITDIKVNTVVLQILYPDSFLRPSTWVYRAPEELTHGARNVFTDVYAFASTTYIVSTPFLTSVPVSYVKPP